TAPRPDYTIYEYITGLSPPGGAKPTAQYAWWESRNARIVIGSLVGLLAIGGVWPFVLRMIGGAAFAVPKPAAEAPPDYDLDRFKSEPPPVPAPSGPSAEALAHLHELEEEMIRN